MEKKKKRRSSLISNISIGKKVLFIDGMVIAVLIIITTAMYQAVSSSQKDKYKQMEKTAVTATEQIADMYIENAVSLANSIYTNGEIYDFLNVRYTSSSAYYEAYYPLQKNTVLNIANTNMVNTCFIYTANETVLSSGSVFRLDDAKDSYWYQRFKKMNKPIILCIDPADGTLILVRSLNYQNLETGESYLCLELNSSAIEEFVDNLGFDGDLYVMSGGKLLYTSDDEKASADDIAINPDFECIAGNYYTADFEFYSCARRYSASAVFFKNKRLVFSSAAILILIAFASLAVYISVRFRVKNAVREYRENGNMDALDKGSNGRDDIGQLLDICCEMSDGMMKKGDESRISSDVLQQKNSAYNRLFATAMRLDAELAVEKMLPELKNDSFGEEISLADEAELVRLTAEKHGAVFSSQAEFPENVSLPAYSLALIANDIFNNYGKGSVKAVNAENGILFTFECSGQARSTDALKLSAIFEDNGIAEEYSFDKNYRFNPYLRLKHCLGSNAGAEVETKTGFRFDLAITYPEGE